MSSVKPRHQARVVALQSLYQLDIQRAPVESITEILIEGPLQEAGLTGETADYARNLATGAWTNHPLYDQMIAGVSAHWDVARMAVVDRNILRLSLFELLEHPEVPARVIIDEAIEIGREFGDAESPQFINGVLDAIWKNHPACRVARGEEK